MRFHAYWALLSGILLLGCGTSDNPLLGKWQGVSATQGGDSLQLDPAEISFQFNEQGIYHYHSTLNYHEAGHFRKEKGRLFATDTTRQNTSERIVAIDLLSADSLILRWRNGEAEQTVILLKQ